MRDESATMASSQDNPFQGDDAQRQTLVQRARRLAQPAEDHAGDTRRAEVDVLLFRVENERHAVALELLHSVLGATAVTDVPCAPQHIAGIVNVRGEIISVIDLGTVLGLPGAGEPATSERWVVLVQLPQGKVGLAVDEVLGMGRIAPDALERSISGRDFVAGIHEGQTILLDLPLLLTPERLDVFEPVT